MINIPFYTFVQTLDGVLKDCDSVLDVGCGSNSPLNYIKNKTVTGVDGYKKSISDCKKKYPQNKYIVLDVNELEQKFKPKSFDAVIALDVIEHLYQKDGVKLLKNMEKTAKKKVILITPNGFIRQVGKDNKLQEHLSGWDRKDFKKRGYKVEGMYGWKPLRKEEAELRFKPKILCGLLSELTHRLYTKYNPKHAFSLFVYKEIN